MPHYLTNVDKNENKQHNVELAAKLSGQDVRYQEGPMPPKEYEIGTYYARNYRANNFNHLDCIVGYEDGFDYSKFWAELRKLEGKE